MNKRNNFHALIILIFPLVLMAEPDIKNPEDNPSRDKKEHIAPKITMAVDKKQVAAGDIFKIDISYDLPSDSKIVTGESFQNLKKLTVVRLENSKGRMKISVLADKTEDFTIGPFTLTFLDKKGDKNLISTDTVKMKFISRIPGDPKQAKLKPIRDIVPVTSFWQKYRLWLLLTFLIGVVVIAVFLWIKKRQRPFKDLSFAQKPHEIALEEIKRLKSKKLFEKGEIKEFYFILSEIMRKYMESIRDFPARELTTEEIARKITLDADKALLNLLKESDLIKFANLLPDSKKKDSHLSEATVYIENTKPKDDTIDGVSDNGHQIFRKQKGAI